MIEAINAGDTAWMLAGAALVFLISPAFALLYRGQKALVVVLKECLLIASLVLVQWMLFGYSLAFGPDHGGWIGTLAWIGLRGVGIEPTLEYAGTVPHLAFMIHHAMLAVIPLVLIWAACGNRARFGPYCLFVLLWSSLVYDPVAHWVWGVSGFLRNSGTLDFAGGIVIHVNAGAAAMAAALMLRKRRDPPGDTLPPREEHYAALGAVVLWFGWWGFNGNALTSSGLAAGAFVASYAAAASAVLVWSLIDRIFKKHPSILGMLAGTAAGLISIAPAAGYVTPGIALGIGAVGAVVCYITLASAKAWFSRGDSFDVIGLHGVGGAWGALATGLWAAKAMNAQVLIQLKSVLAVSLYSFGMSWFLLKLVDVIVGLRVIRSRKTGSEAHV
jgi:Amt family ammonium transporter